jgi:hypothetical protein
MIIIKVKGGRTLSGVVDFFEREFPLDGKSIWLGRGEDILEKEGEGYAVDLSAISHSVSRIHACLAYSPAYTQPPLPYPSYFLKLPALAPLPGTTLSLIRDFLRPTRQLVLRDWHSKTGIFIKGQVFPLSAGLEIVLGDCRPLLVEHQ